MTTSWFRCLPLALALTAGCAPSIALRVQARCRTRTGPYYFSPMPRPTSPPERERTAPTPLALRSLDAQHLELVVGGTCIVRARLQSSAGSFWRPARRYQVEAGQRCSLELPEEGVQSVSVNGTPLPRDPNVLDGPPEQEPSWVFVDNNSDVDVLLRGRTAAGEYDLSCEYRVPR